MKASELPALIIGGTVVVAALATLTMPSGWILLIPLALVLAVYGRVLHAH